MRRHQPTVWLALAVLLMGSNWALGQQRERTTEVTSTTTVHRTSTVIGASVTIAEEASIGKVEDFVLSESGCIEYLVVVAEERLVLVPWTVATVNFDRRVVRIDITREKWREVPTFTRDRFPSLSDRAFTEKVHTAFGTSVERRGVGRERGREIPPPRTERPGGREPPPKQPVKEKKDG